MNSNSIQILIDAICDNFMQAVNNGKWKPVLNQDGEWITYCNFFVDAVAKKVCNYTKFWMPGTPEPMMANQIYDFIYSSLDWMKEADGHMAQIHANNGVLVLAAQKNPSGHGHVCVIRPGVELSSAHWEKFVPRVANVGKDVFIDKAVNYAFQIEPEYFALKSMLD